MLLGAGEFGDFEHTLHYLVGNVLMIMILEYVSTNLMIIYLEPPKSDHGA